MLTEIKNVFLYGKLQDGLRIDLVSKASAISGFGSTKLSGTLHGSEK